MPLRTIHDRARTRRKTPLTSQEWISGLRLARRGAQAGVAPPATGSYIEKEIRGRGLQNAEIAFRGFWYKLEEPQPLRRPSQTHLGPSARAPTDRGTWGFGKGVVSSDFADQWKLAIARAERRPSTWVGWASWVGVRAPMHTDLPRKQNWPFRAPRANSSRAGSPSLYPGGHRSGPHRGVRRDPGVRHSRLIRAVSTRRATQSCIDPAFWAEPFWRPGARHACVRARRRKKGAPTR
jgi:hypothetical protein